MNSPSGGIQLVAEFSPPAKPNAPVLILAHPHPRMGGDMHNKVIDQLFCRSKEKGWGVVRFNFRGVGGSTGEFDHGSGETEDFLNILHKAAAEFNRAAEDFTLVGYSFGSWITALAAARLPKARKLILIAPPIRTMDYSPILSVRHPKHVFAAERDEYVAISETETWFQTLLQPKSLHVVREATHFFVGHTTELVRAVLRTIED